MYKPKFLMFAHAKEWKKNEKESESGRQRWIYAKWIEIEDFLLWIEKGGKELCIQRHNWVCDWVCVCGWCKSAVFSYYIRYLLLSSKWVRILGDSIFSQRESNIPQYIFLLQKYVSCIRVKRNHWRTKTKKTIQNFIFFLRIFRVKSIM